MTLVIKKFCEYWPLDEQSALKYSINAQDVIEDNIEEFLNNPNFEFVLKISKACHHLNEKTATLNQSFDMSTFISMMNLSSQAIHCIERKDHEAHLKYLEISDLPIAIQRILYKLTMFECLLNLEKCLQETSPYKYSPHSNRVILLAKYVIFSIIILLLMSYLTKVLA